VVSKDLGPKTLFEKVVSKDLGQRKFFEKVVSKDLGQRKFFENSGIFESLVSKMWALTHGL